MTYPSKKQEMLKDINFALVSKEEQQILFELANRVPRNGVIVEIGTAQGGTAAVFHQATLDKGVKIYTVDSSIDLRVRENLDDTEIIIINKDSSEFAGVWANEISKNIDLLYIDGDHKFKGIYDDFYVWAPFLNLDSCVVFHDYDPPYRGGLVHFAVRVFLDTLIRHNIFKDPVHEHKILYSKLKQLGISPLPISDYFQTICKIGEEIEEIRKNIFSDSIALGINTIIEKKQPLDIVQICYLLNYALKHDLVHLDKKAKSSRDFRHWTEHLFMFGHAFGVFDLLEVGKNAITPKSTMELSGYIAKEQVRITILSLILRSLVDWNF